MAFKDNLVAAMALRGIDQSELARRLNVSPSAVNQWCKGTTVPNPRRIQSIARELQISEADLLTEVNAPSNPERSATPNARPATNVPPLPNFQSMPRDVPVFGTAQGGGEGA